MKGLQKNFKEISSRSWWQKPGFGIMYQIEARPGWIWERDFDKFNASMKNQDGGLNFNGPLCKMEEWVHFSKRVGVDYHIFESKWHDGICYFDTKYTDWKTPTDYCKIFAEESNKHQIPFMFYYSSVFDHNPQFDDIQPVRNITSSFIALHRDQKEEVIDFCLMFTQFIINQFVESIKKEMRKKKDGNIKETHEDGTNLNINDAPNFLTLKMNNLKQKKAQFTYNPAIYETYLRNQMIELIEKYEPYGMWMDWFMKSTFKEGSTRVIMDLMKEKYPHIVLTFNNSINEQPEWAHYLSGEAHTVDSAWQQGKRLHRKKSPWELVGPAAKSWFDPTPRPDPLELARIAVIIMANGGKICFGLPSQMDGSLYFKPAQHLENFGKWYELRRSLFTEAIPMDYKGAKMQSIKVNDDKFGLIGSVYANDTLIHIINFRGDKVPINLEFALNYWDPIKRLTLKPNDVKLEFSKTSGGIFLMIPREYVDPVDTIVRIVQ
jgi:hypothetical protein